MKNRNLSTFVGLAPLALLLSPLVGYAQVPVDDDGNVIGVYDDGSSQTYSTEPATGNEGIPLLSSAELEELVGPIALYPDDLLAVVLPASTYPLQVVQAARFLEDLESNASLKPDSDWDDSIIALVNYPEVVDLLNEDLDWTWRLGEAVVSQQADVVNAVEGFRNRAYAAGNLKSDDYQTVTRDEGIIEITPVSEEIIYVPYYEPTRVVHYQPRPVYYYYPRPCPVYYYPYASNYAFNRGYFWGVTTAFRIGWSSNHLRVFHHSYHGHPYYGRYYRDRWWYRRPTINVHNNVYINRGSNVSRNRYTSGDNWRSNRNTRLRSSDQRITRSVHYPNNRASSTTTSINRANNRSADSRTGTTRRQTSGRTSDQMSNQIRRDLSRRNDRNQARQSGSTVQRERQVESRDGATTTRQRQSGQSQLTERQSSQRQANQRQTVQSQQRRYSQRETVQRQTNQRQASQRQTNQRQTQQRQATQNQRVAVANQRRNEPVRQSNRQTSAGTQRRTQPTQPVQRQRQSTQRQSQAPQRQPQSSERRSQRAEPSKKSQSRSESTSRRSDSSRRSSRR